MRCVFFTVALLGCQVPLPLNVLQIHGRGPGAISRSAAEQDRKANAEENEAAELKRQRENAEIRETGKRLQADQSAQALPERLTRSMISEAVTKVKVQVMSCSAQSSSKGQVLVSVKVADDGQVSAVTVVSTPDPTLGTCVSSALQQATFTKTQTGGSFRYPFVF